MQIGYVVNNDWGGGVFNAALDTCRGIASRGHQATLLTLVSHRHSHEEKGGVEVASLSQETAFEPQIPERVHRWITDFKLDIVLFGNSPASEESIPYLPPEIRCVMTVHDAAKSCWRNALRFEKDLDSIVTVSKYVANEFRSKLVQPDKIEVIHNGSQFTDDPEIWPERAGDIVFIGSPNGLKGDQDIPPLWQSLLERGFQGRLHCIGRCDPSAMRAVERLPLSERVVQHGRIPRAQVYDIARRSMISLALCRCEAFGLAAAEAAAMGCMIVTWDIKSGITEIVKVGANGLVVPYCDFRAMADAIVETIDNYGPLSAEIIRYSRDSYSLDRMAMNYEQHLQHVVSLPLTRRSRQGENPPHFVPSRKLSRLIPAWMRQPIISYIRRSPTLHLLARNLRRM